MKFFALCLPLAFMASSLSAITTIWDGGTSGTWNTPTNWNTDNTPTSADNVQIDNATVTINASSNAGQIQLGGSGTSSVTLEVNNTLLYADTFDGSDWGVSGDSIVVNINNGGVIDATGAGGASRIAGFADVKIKPGGVLTGVYRTRLGIDFTLTGGTFILYGTSDGTRTGPFGLNTGTSIVGSSGTVVFAASANSVNTSITSGASSTLDLSSLTVQIDILSGYTPQVGDAFDLHSPGGTYDLGDGTNIASLTADGNYSITWDTTNWSTQGKLTIDSVSTVPEPTHYAMILALAGAVFAIQRRRQR